MTSTLNSTHDEALAEVVRLTRLNTTLVAALQVLQLTPHTAAYLERNDKKAWAQLQVALGQASGKGTLLSIDPEEVLNGLACDKCDRPFVANEIAFLVDAPGACGQAAVCAGCQSKEA